MTTERNHMYTPPNPPVTLIAGARCPSCGDLTLGVRGSKIVCLGGDCTRPEAAHDLLALDPHQHEHVVEFTETGFTVKHALLERVDGDLFKCPLHAALGALRAPLGLGRFRVPRGDLRAIQPLAGATLAEDYLAIIERAEKAHPLDDFAVGSVVLRAQHLRPDEPLRDGWLPCDGEAVLDPAEYPEFAAVHVAKGGNPDEPIGVPDLRANGDIILRVR